MTIKYKGSMDVSEIDFPTTNDITDCLDEDDMVSDSATALSTQQAIKAYTDSEALVWGLVFG